MRIAFLTSRLPYPPIGGDRVRAFHVIRHLLKGHRVRVYAIGSPLRGSAEEDSAHLMDCERRIFPMHRAAYAWNVLKGLISELPLQVKLYETPRLLQGLKADVERGEIDLIFVHLLRMAEYARPFPEIPRILDMVDSLCLHYRRMAASAFSIRKMPALIDSGRVCRYECAVPTWFDSVLLTSQVDLDFVQEASRAANLRLVQNGVELSEFSVTEQFVDPQRIVFMGKLDYLPNADAAVYFAKQVLPIIRRSVPGARLLIVGFNPTKAVRALSCVPGIGVLANVPDVRPAVAGSAVSVAPLRFGAGIQNKVLESLALGVPVVASAEAGGAFRHHRESPLLVGGNAEDLAGHVVRLLTDGAFREKLSRQSRIFVERWYAWERVLKPLDDALQDALTARGRRAIGAGTS